MPAPRRIHITGGPGAGKTRLAGVLAQQLALPSIQIDALALRLQSQMPQPLDLPAFRAMRVPHSENLAAQEAWISDGTNLEDSLAFYERADLIVALDCPWRVAAYRIVARHVKASVAGTNQFPGLGKLWRFWHWSRRYYRGTNPWGVNEWGTPNTRAYLERQLQAYAAKLVVCRTEEEINALVRRLTVER